MIFDKYSKDVEFSYQLSAVLNFTFLKIMYPDHFDLTSVEKDKMVDALIDADIENAG